MKTLNIILVLAATACITALHAQAPAVTSAKGTYRTGEAISITFTNGPANPTDWIGIYPAGVTPAPGSPSTIWNYLNGTQTAPDTGISSGVVNFPAGLTLTGNWVAYLLESDGYNVLASVPLGTIPAPTISLDKSAYATNEKIQVAFENGPGNPADWIGVYPEGVTPKPGPTIWAYLNGTQTATTGKTNGTIVFTNGLSQAGRWVAYFLEDDGYTPLASAKFSVGQVPAVQVEHSSYYAAAPFNVSFTNGPANPKDWIGIYPETVAPGTSPATLRQYTDAGTGQVGKANGTVAFSTGLTNSGVYVAYLLENDGSKVIASNKFTVLEADAPLLWVDKRLYETQTPITAFFTNAPGNAKDWVGIYPAGVTPGPGPITWLYLDGTQTGTEVVTAGKVTFANGLRDPGDFVAYLFENDGYTFLAQEGFTVLLKATLPTNNIILDAPLYFENFESTPEGQLPAGWTVQSFTEVLDETENFSDLNSKTFANWVVIDAARFKSNFLTYNNHAPTDDYKRVLSTNRDNVVNGTVVTNLGTGRFLFADAGYRNGRSQVLYAFTPDFNLTGKTNIHLSYHSIYEQNQDAIGAVEYSIDGGTNWLPIVYMLATADVLTNEQGQVDAVATFTTDYSDVAFYDDPNTGETKGGTYGTFIGAPVTQALAPFISARIDDDRVESKRVEYFSLPKADNQSKVRFRFAYAGTDSWYFGIDDFGIYGSPSGSSGALTASISQTGNSVTISWTGGTAPYHVQRRSTLSSGTWEEVTVPAGATSITEAINGAAAFYRVVGQ